MVLCESYAGHLAACCNDQPAETSFASHFLSLSHDLLEVHIHHNISDDEDVSDVGQSRERLVLHPPYAGRQHEVEIQHLKAKHRRELELVKQESKRLEQQIKTGPSL